MSKTIKLDRLPSWNDQTRSRPSSCPGKRQAMHLSLQTACSQEDRA